MQDRKDTKLAERVSLGTTLETTARSWHENWKVSKSPRYADDVRRRLEADVFPEMGGKPVGEITAPHLLAMAKKIESRGAIDIARRSWQTCGQIFEYALVHGIVERKPDKDVRPGAALKPRKQRHFARVNGRELPELLRKIHAYQGSVVHAFCDATYRADFCPDVGIDRSQLGRV